MDITIILLIVVVFTAVAVIGLTLIQQPKGDMGSAFGGGGSQSMFGSRGSANFLTKSTSWMCFVFFVSSLALAYIYAQKNTAEGVVDQSVIQEVSDLPSIVEASSDTESVNANVDSDLPAIPVEGAVEEATDAVEGAVEAGAEAVESATQEAQDAATEVIEEATGENSN